MTTDPQRFDFPYVHLVNGQQCHSVITIEADSYEEALDLFVVLSWEDEKRGETV